MSDRGNVHLLRKEQVFKLNIETKTRNQYNGLLQSYVNFLKERNWVRNSFIGTLDKNDPTPEQMANMRTCEAEGEHWLDMLHEPLHAADEADDSESSPELSVATLQVPVCTKHYMDFVHSKCVMYDFEAGDGYTLCTPINTMQKYQSAIKKLYSEAGKGFQPDLASKLKNLVKVMRIACMLFAPQLGTR